MSRREEESRWSPLMFPLCLLCFDMQNLPPVFPADPQNTSLVAQLAPNLHPAVFSLKAAKHRSPLLTKEEWTHCLNICLSVILPARLLQEPQTFSDISHQQIN